MAGRLSVGPREPVQASARIICKSQHPHIMHRPIIPVISILAILAGLSAGCSPIRLVDVVTPDGSDVVIKDEKYGPEKRQKLDIYKPQHPRESAPVLVFFYGGSWKNGSRGSYSYVGESLAARGYTVVIPDYRVYPEVRFPAFVEDGALALGWIQRHVPEAARGAVLIGHSAGAHIVGLLALDERYMNAAGVDPTLVRGWVGLAGPYAFQPLEYERTRPVFDGLNDANEARPIHFACAAPLPALLLHGDSDSAVLPEHSRQMASELEQCATPVHFEELEGVNHFDIVLGLSSSFQALAPVLEPLDAFTSGLNSAEQPPLD